MNKALAAVSLAAVFATGAAAETRDVDVGAFTALDAANGVAVEITLGEAPAVVIEGPEDEIDRIDVTVDGDTLRVRPERSGWFNRNNLEDTTVRVSAETLTSVHAANGARVTLEAVAADAEIEIAVANGGLLTAKGACRALEAEAHRGGVLDASELDCQEATVEASMGGVTTVRASQSLDAHASMGGVVQTLGDPASFSSSASMGGVVSQDESEE
jgi:hypothetical protein